MDSINKTRAAIQKQVDQFPPDLCATASFLAGGTHRRDRGQAAGGDGASGLDDGAAAGRAAPESRKALLAAAIGSRSGPQRAIAPADAFRDRYEAAGVRLQDADGALVKEHLPDADRIYPDAAKQYRELLTELNEHIGRLMNRGRTDLDAGQFTTAAESFQAVLKIRPADVGAKQLARRWRSPADRPRQVTRPIGLARGGL